MGMETVNRGHIPEDGISRREALWSMTTVERGDIYLMTMEAVKKCCGDGSCGTNDQKRPNDFLKLRAFQQF